MAKTNEPVVLERFTDYGGYDRPVLLGYCPWKTTDRWPCPVSNRVFSVYGLAPTIPAQSNNTVPQVLVEYG